MKKSVLRARWFAALLALGMFLLPATFATADILDLSGATVEQSSIHGPGNPAFLGSHVFDNDPNTRWASEFPFTDQWVSVDLGSDQTLGSISIDWETANATNYFIRTRTAAQGFTPDPADWTVVATLTGAGRLPNGGAKGLDHEFDFAAGTFTDVSGFVTGGGTIDVPSPSGRYLMIHATDYSQGCCGGASIWEVTVDTNPIPEPTSIVLAAIGLAGLGLFGSRRRKSRS
ncbi:MAG: discoidin domain-containing protein [Planctomycetes bacterium]|nr:discoidin domain-containing protein [Planctomycetota bacterium]